MLWLWEGKQGNKAGKTHRDDSKSLALRRKTADVKENSEKTQCCALCKGGSVPQFREGSNLGRIWTGGKEGSTQLGEQDKAGHQRVGKYTITGE